MDSQGFTVPTGDNYCPWLGAMIGRGAWGYEKHYLSFVPINLQSHTCKEVEGDGESLGYFSKGGDERGTRHKEASVVDIESEVRSVEMKTLPE
jgi:hypothetical protein